MNFEGNLGEKKEDISFKKNFQEYTESIKNNPIIEGILLKKIDELAQQLKKAKAEVKNKFTLEQIKDLAETGLAEDITPENHDDDQDPFDDDFYTEEMNNGYRVLEYPLYNEEMNIGTRKYITWPVNPNEQQDKIINNINTKHALESSQQFFYEQEAKENLLKEKVRNGEMVFIGEMSLDDYIELRKESKDYYGPKNFELIPCFTEDKTKWTDQRRVYAYTGVEKDDS